MVKNKIGSTLFFAAAATILNKIDHLDLAHGCNVHGLNVVFKVADLLAQFVDGDLLVLDNAHHLELIDAIADRHELGGAPHKALHLDGLDLLQHGIHVRLVIPRLDIEEDRGLGDYFGLLGLKRNKSLMK